MKTHFLPIAFLLLIAVKSFAQIEKGTVAVGGSGSFSYQGNSYSNGNKGNTISFSLSPNAGVFVAKNFMIGGHVGYGLTSENDLTLVRGAGITQFKDKLLSQTFAVGPDFRYYIKLTDKVYVHFIANASFTIGNVKENFKEIPTYNFYNIYTQVGANWSAGAGISYFINKSIAIAITPSYGGSYAKTIQAQNSSIANKLMNGFIFNAGFNIFIPQKNAE